MLNKPIHFAPYLKSVIWGGERIAPFKGIKTDQHNIGESWEISSVPGHISVVDRGPLTGKSLKELIDIFGADLIGSDNYHRFGSTFPLLIKVIDAKTDISVQVHPDDVIAQQRHNSFGKTELWHIIDVHDDAKIYTGLKSAITPEEYERRVADHTIMDVIAAYDSAPGATFMLPAGRIHAIGAGNLLAEIQQTSDITYRIYDYDRRDKDGKPRELHTEQAKDAIDYTVYPDYESHPEGSLLAECEYFDVRRIILDGSEKEATPVEHPRDSFTIIMCLEGEAEIIDLDNDGASFPITRGETLLFPAVMTRLATRGNAILLSVQS